MFTSGTTGEPKGALATHRARMTWISSGVTVYGLARDDRYLSAMPLVHSAGLTMALMHLEAGARVRIMPRFDAKTFLRLVFEKRITSALAVPTMLAMLLSELNDDCAKYDLSSLRRLITCGAPLSQATKSAALTRLSSRLYDFYGSTESNSMTVLCPSDQVRKPRSVGKPFPNVEIRIAGPAGEAVPVQQVGEIWSSNPSTMSRYLDAPEATTAAFSGRWYRTGDLGYLDEEGYLHLVGRAQELIISGGVNVYPPEIESALMEHPDIRDCAVVGMADETWGQVVKAFIAPRGEARLTLGEVQAHCKQRLADFKKPRQIEIVAEIPRNAGGKVVKSVLTKASNDRA
jgi:acyl-CoA synthetase (AMP-forming)/AMP-acid ligase II